MHRIFISLGSNLGDRKESLNKAKQLLQKETGSISACSSIYETEPWGFVHENFFYNQVLEIHTTLNMFSLLAKIHAIEQALGRTSYADAYSARTIDIDILFFDDLTVDSPGLKIPHPFIQDRLFVLIPLCELAPRHMHPVLKLTILELLEKCTDDKSVEKVY